MSRTASSLWGGFKSSLYHMADLSLALAFLVGGAYLVLSLPAGNVVRLVVTVPLALFVPGYGIVAALIPESADESTFQWSSRSPQDGGLDVIERVALSVALSVTVLPLVGLTLSMLGLPLETATLLTALALVASTAICIGAARRHRLPRRRQFRVPVGRWRRRLQRRILDASSRSRAVVNVSLVVVVVLAITTLGYGVLGTRTGEADTGVALLTKNESGAYVAAGYPETLNETESETLSLRIANRERESVDYTVVVAVQQVHESDSGVRVSKQRELRRFRASVAAGETWYGNHTLSTTMDGETFRVVYLLYRGEPPADPTVTSAYRYTSIWIGGTDAERRATAPRTGARVTGQNGTAS